MDLNQNRKRLESQKEERNSLVSSCFTSVSIEDWFFRLCFPDDDFTPLSTHTSSFLLTTVAQSDTVSLSDNRPLFTLKETSCENNSTC